MTTGFTDMRVRDWTAVAPRRWLRWVLAAAWVAAIATSITMDTTACTTEDLTVCGPDPVFSVALVFCFGAIALLWWRPLVAAACAVIFAGLEVAFDEVAAAKISWVLVALLFVGYAVHLRRGVEQQRRIAREAQVHLPLFPPPAPDRFRLDGPHQTMAVAAVGLVLVAAGSVYGYSRAVGLDAEHLDRSHVVEGVVRSEPNDDLVQRVELTRRPEGVPASIEVEFLNAMPIGTDVVVRVDPADLSWSHPVAEPPDRTWWFTVGLGALFVAGLLAERVLRVRVQRRRLVAVRHEVGVPVRVFTDDLDFVGLVATDSARGLAEFPVAEALSLDRPEDRRVAPPSGAYLVGDVCAGGWAAVLSPSGLQLPMGPLAALPPDTEVDIDSFDKDPEDPHDWSEAVPEGAVPSALPTVIGPSTAMRLLDGAVVLIAVGLGSWILWDETMGFGDGGVVVGAAVAMHWGLSQLAERVSVDRTGFEIGRTFSTLTTPMSAVGEVRVADGETALVIFNDESVLELTPADGDGRGLAAAIEAAVAAAPTATPLAAADRQPLTRPSWTIPVFAVGLLIVAGVWLYQWLG